MNFTTSVNLGNFLKDYNLADSLKMIKECGFDGVDFSLWYFCQGDDAPLRGHGPQMVGVAPHAIGHLAREVEATPALLEPLHDAHALLVVPEETLTLGARGVEPAVACHGRPQSPLPRMAEGRVAEVVPQCYGLGEIDVERKRAGDGARHLCDLERVREPRTVVVTLWCQEHLRLVREPAEALAVHDAVAVPLEAGAQAIGLLGTIASHRGVGEGRLCAERLVLLAFPHLACHGIHGAPFMDASPNDKRGKADALPRSQDLTVGVS